MFSLASGLPITPLLGNFAETKDILTTSSTEQQRVHRRVSKHQQNYEELYRIYYEKYATKGGTNLVAVLMDALRAINAGIFPERISQGSSGSYFVKNLKMENIGIFKPKDEEPYGALNPKWLKCMQRLFFPCCFGRSCLVPNQGYLCEAGAWLVDYKLGLNVVPKTAIIFLTSPTFNYHRMDRAKKCTKQHIVNCHPALGKCFKSVGLQPKRGSFQVFVNGYKDASAWLNEWNSNPEGNLPPTVQEQFQLQFERMIILDYLIRNTDRGNDNWLVRYDPPLITDEGKIVRIPQVKIAAIDNGLAFPFKHPDQWRAYPYGWASLPMAQIPFSEETIQGVLPLIDNIAFVRHLCEELREIFKTDPGFDKHKFERQLNVFRGQMFNLRETLRTRKSPAYLAQMVPQYMIELTTRRRKRIAHQRMAPALTEEELVDPRSWHNTFRQVIHTQSPLFSCC